MESQMAETSREELFQANIDLIDSIVAGICRRSGLRDADAEDFASLVKLALMEDDYRILRAYEGRSSLGTYLTIVIRRLLASERTRVRGKWHPSAEALRMGDAAVLLERLVYREGRSVEQALPFVRALDSSIDHDAARALAARLPQRAPRPQFVALSDDDDFTAGEQADAQVSNAEATVACQQAALVLRRTLSTFSLEERMLIRFHFGAGLSVADAARMLGIEQRPLYRRIESLLRRFRSALESEGIDAAAVGELINAASMGEFDFDLEGVNGRSPRSLIMPSVVSR